MIKYIINEEAIFIFVDGRQHRIPHSDIDSIVVKDMILAREDEKLKNFLHRRDLLAPLAEFGGYVPPDKKFLIVNEEGQYFAAPFRGVVSDRELAGVYTLSTYSKVLGERDKVKVVPL